jgi:hypothetical protein
MVMAKTEYPNPQFASSHERALVATRRPFSCTTCSLLAFVRAASLQMGITCSSTGRMSCYQGEQHSWLTGRFNPNKESLTCTVSVMPSLLPDLCGSAKSAAYRGRYQDRDFYGHSELTPQWTVQVAAAGYFSLS